MKTKLLFSTETNDMEIGIDLPFIPRINEWFNVKDILKAEEMEYIKKSAHCWSGVRGTVQSVEYCKDEEGFYAEVYVWCED